MTPKFSIIVVAVLFVVFMFATLSWLTNIRGQQELVESQLQAAWLMSQIGLFLVTLSVLALISAALAGLALSRLSGLIAAALSGALLLQPSWSVAFSLGLAAVAFALANVLRREQ